MLQRRKQEALARANGTSRRAGGWAGEKAARIWRAILAHSRDRRVKAGSVILENWYERAWRDHSYCARSMRAVKDSPATPLGEKV